MDSKKQTSPQPRLLPFLTRHSLPLSLALIAIAAIRIVSTYSVFSNTSDEPTTLGCGLQYLGQHKYTYEPQHPPLARAMVALLPYLAGERPHNSPDMGNDGRLVIFHSGNPDRILMLMRLGILPFFILGGLVVFAWSRHHFGGAAAAIAVALYTLLPALLAHGGLGTLDMTLAANLAAAFLAMLLWAETPDWRRALLLGVTTGLAVVSRMTALGYFPAGVALALLGYIAAERPGAARLLALAKARIATFALGVTTGALVIWAVYLFSFGTPRGWTVRVPAPEFFTGVGDSLNRSAGGHTAYLFGHISLTGWWYYFPVVLAFKTPIAFLVLLAIGLGVCWKNRASWRYLAPLAFSLGILLPAMNGHVNIGVRLILPVYIGFCIVAALGLLRLLESAPGTRWAGLAAAALCGWLVLTGIARHPDYLAYFNEFAGGDPETVLVDSDLDWKQDHKRLAHRLRELGVKEVNFGWHGDDEALWPELPTTVKINPLEPAEGWTAISPTLDRLVQYGLGYRYPNLRPWYDYLPPKEHVGTLRLYYLPPGSLRK